MAKYTFEVEGRYAGFKGSRGKTEETKTIKVKRNPMT